MRRCLLLSSLLRLTWLLLVEMQCWLCLTYYCAWFMPWLLVVVVVSEGGRGEEARDEMKKNRAKRARAPNFQRTHKHKIQNPNQTNERVDLKPR